MRTDVEPATERRLGWWLKQGAEIICGGSAGDAKAPLKRSGADGGSYHEDAHTSTSTIPDNARSYGLRFTSRTPQVLIDVDVKGSSVPPAETEAMRVAEAIVADLGDTYWEVTPSGGRHYVYERPLTWCAKVSKGKVAKNFADGSGIELFFATGWCRTAPTTGFVIGNDTEPASIAPDDLDRLVGLFAPPPPPPRPPRQSTFDASTGESMMDWAVAELERRGGLEAVLLRLGWDDLGRGWWRRPNWEAGHAEDSQGKSARINDSGRLVVFSGSTPLGDINTKEPSPTYDALDVMAAYEFGGDRVAAARSMWDRRPDRHEKIDTGAFAKYPRGARNARPADENWPEPLPVGDQRELPAFPVHALPSWMAEQVADVARDIQVSPDLPAMLGLVALATIAAKRVKVAITPTWQEHVNLYVAVALPPSTGKSPAFKAMLGPVQALERTLRDEVAEVIDQAQRKRRILEKKMKAMEDAQRIADADEIAAELRKMPVQVRPQLLADDATPEKLVVMMGEQGGRIAVLSPEGEIFGMMAGRYSDKANLGPYLKAYSGEDIKVDRIGRDQVDVREAVLTIGVAVQPVALEELADEEMRGKGLAARFMYAVPPDLVGTRDMSRLDEADAEVRTRYATFLTNLARRLLAYQAPGVVPLDTEARSVFVAFRQRLEVERGPAGELRAMAEWTGKLEQAVARTAGLLHVADHGATGAVDGFTMAKAVEIGEFWLGHARVVHDLWKKNPDVEKARVLLRWIAEEGLEEFSVRDAHYARKKHFERVDDLVAPLEVLVERLWIKPLFDGPLTVGRRGFVSPRFVVTPRIALAKGKVTTERQTVVAHVAHVPKGEFLDLSSSVETRTHTDLAAHGPHGPQLVKPSTTCPVDNPIGGGRIDDFPAALAPAPHPSLAPEELGF